MSVFFIFLPLSASSFILIHTDYRLANPRETVVNIAGQTCPNVGVSNDTIRAAIEISIEQFWNTVAESELRLKMGEVVDKTTADQVNPGEILVSCDATSSGNGGSANPNIQNGTAFIALDSEIGAAGFNRIVGVVIHEMGHAIGLNHSADNASVMTYESHDWGLKPDSLSQDDKNGVVYLYPIAGQASGLIPGCSVDARQSSQGNTAIIWGIMQEILGLISVIFVLKFLTWTLFQLREKGSQYLRLK